MSCRLARTSSCDKIPLRLRDSCRSTSRCLRHRHHCLVQSPPAPPEKFRRPLRRLAISPAVRPRRSRVDLTRKVAWLDHGTTKSGDGRGIPLNADAVAALEATRGQHPRWCLTFLGKRIQQSSTAWGMAKQRAGIEDFRFHDLRHTWASWHVQSGTSLPELMELGGWKSYEMVLRYAHLAPEKLSFVAGRIERQASRPIEDGAVREKRSKKRYVFATVGTLSARKFLINWCARRDSNSRPPGS
jgi:hypothetical protein